MAGYRHKKEEIKEQALSLCRKGGLLTIRDIIAFLPIEKTRFYSLFPAGSRDLKDITNALDDSKRKACVSIRGRLYEMKQNPTAQLAVYKMLCTEEERAALSMVRTDITTQGEKLKTEPIVIQVIDSCEQVEKQDSNA